MNDTATTWGEDAELFACLKNELFTAVVGDVLDAMGHRGQFLPPGIAPLAPKAKIAGRAMKRRPICASYRGSGLTSWALLPGPCQSGVSAARYPRSTTATPVVVQEA